MKLSKLLSEDQQQLLADGIIKAAVAHGIIKDPESTQLDDAIVFHLLSCLAEAPQPRKKIVMFESGVIHGNGNCAFLTLAEDHPGLEVDKHEVKTSPPVSPAVEGQDELTWFETLNTIYIMAPGGQPVTDCRLMASPRTKSEE